LISIFLILFLILVSIGSKFRGISILNDGPDDVQVDFDHVVDGDSRKIPSGVALNISQDFLVLHYKDINNTGATLYVTFIQNP